MRRLILVIVLALIVGIWWVAWAPRPEIEVAGPLAFDPATEEAIRAVDRSSEFGSSLQQFPSTAPAFDDAVFLPDGATALMTAIDGQIWRMNLANHSAEPLVDPPLMAYGIHDAPGDPDRKSVV